MLSVKINKSNLKEYIQEYEVVLCSLKTSRNKAKQLAVWELCFALNELAAIFVPNGPLGDTASQVTFLIHKAHLEALPDILKSIGYCNSFYALDFSPSPPGKKSFSWKGMPFTISLFYKQSEAIYEKQSSHNRDFYIYDSHGQEKKVVGYRGDGSVTGRRALPVEDCRLLVNLVNPLAASSILDPFAGSGGILSAARYANPSIRLISADIDKVVEPGLKRLSDVHYTIDSSAEDIVEHDIAAIVTEVPFAPSATETVGLALTKLAQNLSDDGQISLMCSEEQYPYLSAVLQSVPLYPVVEEYVDRQGNVMSVSLWYKQYVEARQLDTLTKEISLLF